jgi:hypothetical protein
MSNGPDFTRLIDELEKANLRKNITTVQEFDKFQPLFSEDCELPDTTIRQLSREFCGRFNTFSPIIVKTDDTPDSDVVTTIPPVFTTTKRLDEVPGGKEAMDSFVAANMRPPDPLYNSMGKAAERLKNVMRYVTDEEELAKNERIWKKALEGDTPDEENLEGDLAWE